MYIIFQQFLFFLSVWGQGEIFHKMKDTRMTTDVAIVNEMIASGNECIRKCLDGPKCIGTNYDQISQECKVLSATADTTGNTRNSIQWAKGK